MYGKKKTNIELHRVAKFYFIALSSITSKLIRNSQGRPILSFVRDFDGICPMTKYNYVSKALYSEQTAQIPVMDMGFFTPRWKYLKQGNRVLVWPVSLLPGASVADGN